MVPPRTPEKNLANRSTMKTEGGSSVSLHIRVVEDGSGIVHTVKTEIFLRKLIRLVAGTELFGIMFMMKTGD